jgi:hypothetical protein
MQYALDRQNTVHATRAEHTPYPGRRLTLSCGQAGQWRPLLKFPNDGSLCELCALYMLPEVTAEGYHLGTLARLCRVLGCPKADALASLVWRLSVHILPVSLAEDFMRACGYVPFQGFPLTRLKTPNLEAAPQ